MGKQIVSIDAFNLLELYEGDDVSVIIVGIIHGALVHDRLIYFNLDRREAEGIKFFYQLKGCEINWYQMLIEQKIFLKDFNFDKRLV